MMKGYLGLLLLGFLAMGCTKAVQYGETKTVVLRQTINELEKERVPGTVNDVWVEQMHDTVTVPGALHGVYYRKTHRTVVEIRPGKFQKVQYPNADGSYPTPRRQ
jgi:hypothetical protein